MSDFNLSLAHAIKLYNEKSFEAAGSLLDKLLEAVPGHDTVLFMRGLAYAGIGNMVPAIHMVRSAIQASPGDSRYSAILSVLLLETGKIDDAIHESVSAILAAGANGDRMAYHVLQRAITYTHVKNPPIQEAQRLVMGVGNDPAHRLEEIFAAFQPPYSAAELANARANAAYLLFCGGRSESVVDMMTLAGRPLIDDNEGENERVERNMLEYKDLSSSYDGNDLHIFCNDQMLYFIDSLIPRKVDSILDACCGTGLMGVSLRERCRHLIGFDLSHDMLDVGAKRGVYDRLTQADANDDQSIPTGTFDAVISTAALYHLPDLAPFLKSCAKRLNAGGILAFSTEVASDDSDRICSVIGGYGHSRAYLYRTAESADLETIAVDLRLHRRYPGFFAAFRKKS